MVICNRIVQKGSAVRLLVGILLMCVASSCHTAKNGVNNLGKENTAKEIEKEFPADVSHSKLYREAIKWLGTPYAYGGHSRSGTDCSGFVSEVFKATYDVQLHRNSAEIFDNDCEEISRDDLREGDLVFFTNDSGRRINHVGIYLYDDKFIHSSSSKGVVISDLKQNYYIKHFYKAGRVVKTN